jgi:DNA-binding LytR/AlgR family response regulator
MIGIIPTTWGYFWLKNRGLKVDLQEKEDQNRKLISRVREEDMPDEKIITLSGNTKDSLTVFPGELLYMESAGNYIQIHYRANGQMSQKTLRATLSQMEEQLLDYPFLVRCHRAFIVNSCQIEKIRGANLWLKSAKTKIPVSKTYKKSLSQPLF